MARSKSELKKPVTISYKVELEDWINFSVVHSLQSPAVKGQWNAASVYMIVIFCAGGIFVSTHGAPGAGILFGVMAICTFPFMRWRRSIQMKHVSKKMYNEGANRAVSGTHTLTASPAGLWMKGPLVESKMKWPAVEKVMRTKEYGFVYLSAASAVVIPIGRVIKGNLEALLAFVEAEIQVTQGRSMTQGGGK